MPHPYHHGPPSDHFDGTRFFNPGQPPARHAAADLLRWRFSRRPPPWPAAVPVQPARPEPRVCGLRVTAVGHATFLIQAAGCNVLTDPVWSERVSPVSFAGPHRVTAPGIAWADLPTIDAVLLSHSHYDHLDLPTLRRLHARDAPMVVAPLGTDAILLRAIPGIRLLCADWHTRLALPGGLATTLTPAIHWTRRTLRDTCLALWSGHWLHTPAGDVWFAGDTGYGDGTLFDALRQRLGAPALALIPIGAYEPRWFMAPQHVDPAEAVRIFQQIGAARALGMHWGTFPLADEAREAGPAALLCAMRAAGLEPARFEAAHPGAAYEVPPRCDAAADATAAVP